ncbi:ubiquinone/menaquinone biosynthesis C-methyltransferase UbiE [Parasteatoda tepidariorum]|uniref:ubiquinone/menaquinone biosynthesis C-methyltransferase UbiE n=1 Tax=Parasteatoda tepidariorum TaxID=114398 RepID=UPI001C720F5F|nr:ubiquinone/menaquinone biosynthesis C-methyltransferase UbiE [Parasteatoda tepidariorum]
MLTVSKFLCFKIMFMQSSKSRYFYNKLFFSRKFCIKHSQKQDILDTHSHSFGFQAVSPKEKREKVQNTFSSVAEKYDLMNDVMSVGIHRLWKDYFIRTLSPVEGTKLLDVAGGTGDIAFRCLKASSEGSDATQSHVTVLDFNDKMLSICKKRAEESGLENQLTCVQGNAEMLPFPDQSFDAYTIAFGIRNVVHIDKALSEAHRVLLPGGRFLCLEFSEVQYPLNSVYKWYSDEIIPVLGQVIAGEWKSYQYLVESIQKFPKQEEFLSMIKEAGLSCATYENLTGGIVAIHSAYKL